MLRLLWPILLIACSQVPSKEAISQKEEKKIPPPFQYPVQNIKIFNGKVKFVKFNTPKEDGFYNITCKGSSGEETYKGQVSQNVLSFYLAENYFSEPHQKKCYFDEQHVLNVTVQEFNYKKERLNVPKRKVDLSPKDLERVLKEKEIKEKIYLNSQLHYLFEEPFVVPLKSKITSVYGNQRLFNDKKRSEHLGVDLRAWVGVKIPANNRGRVVFTGDLFFSGNIVVIDHGLEIFTVYMHLSKIMVKEGDIVSKGDIVGLAGQTGRVSGPHLHWGVRINNHWVDGFSLVDESKRHFIKTKDI